MPLLPLPPGVLARTVDVRGPLAVLEAAPAGTPRGTVVLVPGFTGSKEDFRLVLGPLAEAGYHAVALDQRGQFESPGPDDPSAYDVDALGQDLLDLIEQLGGGPAHLVGHSFGGFVTRAAVLKNASAVRSHVLLDSGPGGLTGPRAEVMTVLRPVLEHGGLQAVWEGMEAVAVAHPRLVEVSPELKAFQMARLLGGSPLAMLAMGDNLLAEPDRIAELKEADVPTLVVYGEEDDAWLPPVQDEMAERLGAPVIVIRGAQHSPAAENPAVTAMVLRDFFASI